MSKLKSKFRPAVFPADILYDEGLDSGERFILLILFTYTNAHTNIAYPSQNTIAARAGMSRQGAVKIIDRLVEKGYVIKHASFKPSTKNPGKMESDVNKYELTFKTREEAKTQKVVNSVDNLANNWVVNVVDMVVNPVDKGCNPSLHKLSKELSSELSKIEEEGKSQDLLNLEDGQATQFPTDNTEPTDLFSVAQKHGATDEEMEFALEAMSKAGKKRAIDDEIKWLDVALKDIVKKRALRKEIKADQAKRQQKPVEKAKPPETCEANAQQKQAQTQESFSNGGVKGSKSYSGKNDPDFARKQAIAKTYKGMYLEN